MLLHNKVYKASLLLLLAFLTLGACTELYVNRSGLFSWLGQFSVSFWLCSSILGFLLILFVAAGLLFVLRPPFSFNFLESLITLRERMGWLRWLLGGIIALLPSFVLLFTPLGTTLSGPFFRTILWILSSTAIAFLFMRSSKQAVSLEMLAFTFSLTAALHYLNIKLSAVTGYPFMLIWSEGNRFYDYSVILGSSRYLYPGKLTIPYNDPGRYILWGLPFAIRNTPIWLHRLWDAVLWTVPYLVLGLLLSRLSRLKSLPIWTFALWIMVFLVQGPVYPTLILAAIITVLFVRPGKWLSILIGAAIAGYYAGLSRFTWLPAAATWTAFILLADFTLVKGEAVLKVVRRLLPIAAASLIALGAASLANPTLLKPASYTPGETTTFSQPLLWYRLFPNSTYSSGILLSLGIATLPLICLLVWMITKKVWKLNWLQVTAFGAACIIFLVGGLVASVKIGGGSNLHNLDMLLVSLAIIAALALRAVGIEQIRVWPGFARFILALTLLIPAWKVVLNGEPLSLPDEKVVEHALESVYAKATKAQTRGEVLFMDDRQLLAFEIIKGIRLVPDYEKKYLMDQAMAGDAAYFKDFYADLARQRFSLIISQPMFVNSQSNTEDRFPEENNAWVKWVAGPLLCYYTPIETIPEVQLQFLAPREDPKGCP